MVMLRDLQPASFRGQRFFVPKDQAEEGRNTIPHKYPDSPLRYNEDNGYCPPEFTLSIILKGPRLLADFNALRAALNTPGPGTLQHPWYGPQFVSVMGPWRVNREDADSGVLTLEVKFAAGGAPVFPGRLSGIAAAVTGVSAAFIANLFAQFSQSYGAPASAASRGAVRAAIQTIARDASARFGRNAASASAVYPLAVLTGTVMESGATLGPALSPLFAAPFEGSEYSQAELAAGYEAFDQTFAALTIDAAAIPDTTADYRARASALLAIATAGRAACLSALAQALAGQAFTTADAVHAAQALLNALLAEASVSDLDHALRLELGSVVAESHAVLEAQQIRLPQTATLDIPPAPASWLTYMLYDSYDRLPLICDLNDDQSPLMFERRATVLVETV